MNKKKYFSLVVLICLLPMLVGCSEKKEQLTNDLVLALKQTDQLKYKIVTTVSETYATYSDMEERSLKCIQNYWQNNDNYIMELFSYNKDDSIALSSLNALIGNQFYSKYNDKWQISQNVLPFDWSARILELDKSNDYSIKKEDNSYIIIVSKEKRKASLDKQIQDAKDQKAAYLWDGEVNGASIYTSIIEILKKSEIKKLSYTVSLDETGMAVKCVSEKTFQTFTFQEYASEDYVPVTIVSISTWELKSKDSSQVSDKFKEINSEIQEQLYNE